MAIERKIYGKKIEFKGRSCVPKFRQFVMGDGCYYDLKDPESVSEAVRDFHEDCEYKGCPRGDGDVSNGCRQDSKGWQHGGC